MYNIPVGNKKRYTMNPVFNKIKPRMSDIYIKKEKNATLSLKGVFKLSVLNKNNGKVRI